MRDPIGPFLRFVLPPDLASLTMRWVVDAAGVGVGQAIAASGLGPETIPGIG